MGQSHGQEIGRSIKQLSPTTFIVKLVSGLEWKRHVDHIHSTGTSMEYNNIESEETIRIDIPMAQEELTMKGPTRVIQKIFNKISSQNLTIEF